MSFVFDSAVVLKDLVIGGGTAQKPSEQLAIGAGNALANGSVDVDGLVHVGAEEFEKGDATLMVAKSRQQAGDPVVWIKGPAQENALYIDGDVFVTGKVDCGNKGKLAARFAAADASPKPFDMQHPTKGEGNRLRYACIEGPEVGVYFRGRLRRGKEIFLPNYWKGLVHIQSITVQLQPIGAHQDIIIKRWDDEKIYLQSNGGLPIDCFYHVYAERKDCNPLVVEYQGDGWEDYPDKDYKDPNFSGPPNIITV